MSADPSSVARARRSIDHFLSLLEADPTEVASDEAELAKSLDELAASVSQLPFLRDMSSSSFEEDPDDVSLDEDEWPNLEAFEASLDQESYRKACNELWAKACHRYPELGHYTLLDALEPGHKRESMIRSAIDDIVDIAVDLLSARRAWEEVGETKALWELRFRFEAHWEYHLRGLQFYLFHRRAPDGISSLSENP